MCGKNNENILNINIKITFFYLLLKTFQPKTTFIQSSGLWLNFFS